MKGATKAMVAMNKVMLVCFNSQYSVSSITWWTYRLDEPIETTLVSELGTEQFITLNFIPTLYFQQMAPTKQAKVIKDFQKQSAQLDMTVNNCISLILSAYFT